MKKVNHTKHHKQNPANPKILKILMRTRYDTHPTFAHSKSAISPR